MSLLPIINTGGAPDSAAQWSTKTNANFEYLLGLIDANSQTSPAAPPIEHPYNNRADMIADQSNQTSGFIQFVQDARTTAQISEGVAIYSAYFEYLGTVGNSIVDYRQLGSYEAQQVVTTPFNHLTVKQLETTNILETDPFTTVSFMYDGATGKMTSVIFNPVFTKYLTKYMDLLADTTLTLQLWNTTNKNGLYAIINNFEYTEYPGTTLFLKADIANTIDIAEVKIGDILVTDVSIGGGQEVVVDAAMSDTSTNPVQNKIIKEYTDQIQTNVDALQQSHTDLETEVDGLVSGYKGKIVVADTPTLDGIYSPTQAGTYTNAGGLTYNPTTTDANHLVQFILSAGVWTKNSVPLNILGLTQVVDPTNTEDAVSGQAVVDYSFSNEDGLDLSYKVSKSVFKIDALFNTVNGGDRISKSVANNFLIDLKVLVKPTSYDTELFLGEVETDVDNISYIQIKKNSTNTEVARIQITPFLSDNEITIHEFSGSGYTFQVAVNWSALVLGYEYNKFNHTSFAEFGFNQDIFNLGLDSYLTTKKRIDNSINSNNVNINNNIEQSLLDSKEYTEEKITVLNDNPIAFFQQNNPEVATLENFNSEQEDSSISKKLYSIPTVSGVNTPHSIIGYFPIPKEKDKLYATFWHNKSFQPNGTTVTSLKLNYKDETSNSYKLLANKQLIRLNFAVGYDSNGLKITESRMFRGVEMFKFVIEYDLTALPSDAYVLQYDLDMGSFSPPLNNFIYVQDLYFATDLDILKYNRFETLENNIYALTNVLNEANASMRVDYVYSVINNADVVDFAFPTFFYAKRDYYKSFNYGVTDSVLNGYGIELQNPVKGSSVFADAPLINWGVESNSTVGFWINTTKLNGNGLSVKQAQDTRGVHLTSEQLKTKGYSDFGWSIIYNKVMIKEVLQDWSFVVLNINYLGNTGALTLGVSGSGDEQPLSFHVHNLTILKTYLNEESQEVYREINPYEVYDTECVRFGSKHIGKVFYTDGDSNSGIKLGIGWNAYLMRKLGVKNFHGGKGGWSMQGRTYTSDWGNNSVYMNWLFHHKWREFIFDRDDIDTYFLHGCTNDNFVRYGDASVEETALAIETYNDDFANDIENYNSLTTIEKDAIKETVNNVFTTSACYGALVSEISSKYPKSKIILSDTPNSIGIANLLSGAFSSEGTQSSNIYEVNEDDNIVLPPYLLSNMVTDDDYLDYNNYITNGVDENGLSLYDRFISEGNTSEQAKSLTHSYYNDRPLIFGRMTNNQNTKFEFNKFKTALINHFLQITSGNPSKNIDNSTPTEIEEATVMSNNYYNANPDFAATSLREKLGSWLGCDISYTRRSSGINYNNANIYASDNAHFNAKGLERLGLGMATQINNI